MEQNCKACNRHLGYIKYADILCKCGHYNIIRPNKETKIVVKSLYTFNSKAFDHDTQ